MNDIDFNASGNQSLLMPDAAPREWNPIDLVQAAERLTVRRKLQQGLGSDDLGLVYQPVFDIATRSLVGAEALLRWHPMKNGNVLPTPFLRLVEEWGLIVSIGEWVLNRGISDLAQWRLNQLVGETFRLWINASPMQLADSSFADVVGTILDLHNVPATNVGIEIIEEPLQNLPGSLIVLNALRSCGVELRLDDFGVGHSNLDRLLKLPVNGIKIDGRFVAALDVDDDERGSIVVRNAIGLGRELNICVVAEGIETERQAEVLNSLGCEQGQGYWYGFPTPADQFEQFLDDYTAPTSRAWSG
jgi:EAL domain-containing protein (putative c-di-GMP-specific phosphodiesterase class I)